MSVMQRLPRFYGRGKASIFVLTFTILNVIVWKAFYQLVSQ
jgi:hypothetical protein